MDIKDVPYQTRAIKSDLDAVIDRYKALAIEIEAIPNPTQHSGLSGAQRVAGVTYDALSHSAGQLEFLAIRFELLRDELKAKEA